MVTLSAAYTAHWKGIFMDPCLLFEDFNLSRGIALLFPFLWLWGYVSQSDANIDFQVEVEERPLKSLLLGTGTVFNPTFNYFLFLLFSSSSLTFPLILAVDKEENPFNSDVESPKIML